MMGWVNTWNTIIRRIIFQDEELKSLMKIPQGTSIINFIDNYFIKAGYTNKLLTNETCRIIYSDVKASDTNVPNITRNILAFDIYVKIEDLHNVGNDRLVFRTQLIAARLKYLLMKERYLLDSGYRMSMAGEWDNGTRTNGYARYTIAFYYMKVY